MIGWLTYRSAGIYLSVSTNTIRNWVRSGKLRVSVTGGIHRLRVTDLDVLLEAGYKDSDLERISKQVDEMVGDMQ